MSGEFTTSSSYISANSNASSATCTSSRWLTEEVFKLIEIVQRDEAIYNPRHKYYFCRPYVENFWREVDLKLDKNPGASLAKWTNLRISFRREYTNYLEEKVPPCWSYFDRMFFLHPYLRKKHPQPKSLDTQVQDALAHLSNLSNRMQRERAVAASTSVSTNQHPSSNVTNSVQQSPPQATWQALEYFDEHEHNNSELDDIMDEDQHPLDNDIKSECEDAVDDFEAEHHRSMHRHDDDDHDIDDKELHNCPPTTSVAAAASSTAENRYALQHPTTGNNRLHQFNRLQVRAAYHEEPRALRPRSQELQAPTGGISTAVASTAATTANVQSHSNISFVRPTFTKTVDMVSTTTHGTGGANGTTSSGEVDFPAPSAVSTHNNTNSSSTSTYLTPRHAVHMQPTQRMEVPNSQLSVNAQLSSNAGVVDLCDCKTDPDAMFLMSLLPDIQKLNGRDRGKIKIAFQNILQDYLYPD